MWHAANRDVFLLFTNPTVIARAPLPDACMYSQYFIDLDSNLAIGCMLIKEDPDKSSEESSEERFMIDIFTGNILEKSENDDHYYLTVNNYKATISHHRKLTYDINNHLENILKTKITDDKWSVEPSDTDILIFNKDKADKCDFELVLSGILELGIIDEAMYLAIKERQSIPPVYTSLEETLEILLQNPQQHLPLLKKIVMVCCKNQMHDKNAQQRVLSALRKSEKLKQAFFQLKYHEYGEGDFEYKDYLQLLNLEDANYASLTMFAPIFSSTKNVPYPKGDPLAYIDNLLLNISNHGSILETIFSSCIDNQLKPDNTKNEILKRLGSNKRFINHISLNKDLMIKALKFINFEDIIQYDEKNFAQTIEKELNDGHINLVIHYLLSLPHEKINLFLRELAFNSTLTQKILPYFSKLSFLEIYDGGKSLDTWSTLASIALNATTLNGFSEDRLPITNNFIENWENNISSQDWDIKRDVLDNGWEFFRIQGRTILFKIKNEDKLLALKIQKKHEKEIELHKQYHTVNFLKEHGSELGLTPQETQPLGVKKLSGLLDLINELKVKHLITENDATHLLNSIEATTDSTHRIYAYQAPQDYFTYLHEASLTDEEFFNSAATAFDTYIILLNQGIVFSQLADIFHNQETGASARGDGGRYFTLVNLMRESMSGSGRLNAWKKAVEFLNIRKNMGIVDEGDWNLIEMFTNEASTLATAFFSEVHFKHGPNSPLYIVANFIAEFFLVIELATGLRVLNQINQNSNLSESEITILWKNAATQLHKIYMHGFAKFTHLPYDVIKRLFDQILNVEAYANEMKYGMTNEYIEFTKKNAVPSHLYPGTKVTVDFSAIRRGTFNDKSGFSINNIDSDLGSVNSQNPLKMGDRSRYHLITFGFITRNALLDYHKAQQQGADFLTKGEYIQAQTCFQNAIELNPFSKSARRLLTIVSKIISNKTPNEQNINFANNCKLENGVALFQRHWREKKHRVNPETVKLFKKY